MSFHYHVDCDGCGKAEVDWDSVPDTWITVQHGVMREADHYCEECSALMYGALPKAKVKP